MYICQYLPVPEHNSVFADILEEVERRAWRGISNYSAIDKQSLQDSCTQLRYLQISSSAVVCVHKSLYVRVYANIVACLTVDINIDNSKVWNC